MAAGAGGPIRVRFPIKGPLGISFSASDAASPPLISAISATGLAATVRGLEVGMALVSVQGRSVEHAGFDAAIAAIKSSARPLELEFLPIRGDDGRESDSGSFGSASSAGITALMQAAATSREATVAALRDGVDVDMQDSDGWTALHHACHAGETGSVEELLRAGCAVDVEDAIGETAADVAETAGRSDLVDLLQQHADLSSESRHVAGVSSADRQLPVASTDTARLQRELQHAQAEVRDLQATLATERRCIQTLTDQAHVGRDEALASLLDELELARSQLSVSQRQQRELEDQLQAGISKEKHEHTRLRLRQVEEVLSDMEARMADAKRREEELEKSSKTANAECNAAVREAAAARAEAEVLDTKCREQATKLQQLRRRQSAQNEAAKQEQQRIADEALADGSSGWEAQYREQAELVDTQGRKLRELSRQLAEHRVSKENTMREAETLRTENANLRKTVSALEIEVKNCTADRRKAEQLQRLLNSERERAQAAVGVRNEQHELEVTAMKDEFARLLEQRDKRIAQLTKHSSGDGKRHDNAMATRNARGSNGGPRTTDHRPRAVKAAEATKSSVIPRQSPRRARAHAPARTSRSSPVTATPVEDMTTVNAPATPNHSRAKKLLEQAEHFEQKTQGIGREIKRIGRDARRQQRQLSPEGPSAHDRRHTARENRSTGGRRSVSASPVKARPAASSPATRAGSAGPHGQRTCSGERPKRPSGSPARLSSKAEKQVERLYTNDVERREQWRAQALAEKEAVESKQVRSTSRRRPVKDDEVEKRWHDIQGAQRRKAEWIAAQKLKEEEMEEKELEQRWVMSKGSAAGGKYHVDDGRDVGTRTHAWHDEKKAELQRKERELKRAQKQQERGSLGVPAMSEKSKAYTKDLNSDVIMRNEQFAEQRSAKLAEAKTTREEERAKKQKETITLSKASAHLVSQGRHKDTDVISRNRAFETARQERIAASEYAQKKPAAGNRPTNARSNADSLKPVSPERALSPVNRSLHQRESDRLLTPEEDSFVRNEREAALIRSADQERSPARAYARAANLASSMAREERGPEAPGSSRRTPPPATRAGSSGSVFARGRASKQRQTPSRRVSLSPTISRSSSPRDTAVAFGSTFSPKPDAIIDEHASPRSISSLRSASVHPDVVASANDRAAAAVDRRSPLGDRRPRQDSPVERSLRAARVGDSTPELAADAQQMRQELASLKGMWDKLETVAHETDGTIGKLSSGAEGPDEDDYW